LGVKVEKPPVDDGDDGAGDVEAAAAEPAAAVTVPSQRRLEGTELGGGASGRGRRGLLVDPGDVLERVCKGSSSWTLTAGAGAGGFRVEEDGGGDDDDKREDLGDGTEGASTPLDAGAWATFASVGGFSAGDEGATEAGEMVGKVSGRR